MCTTVLILSICVALGIILFLLFVYPHSASKESYDPSLQYNIQHPFRDQVMREAAIEAPQPPTSAQIEGMRKQLTDWYAKTEQQKRLKSMDKWGKISIEAALDSAAMGNWPIGNVLCYMPKGTESDPTRWIEILRGGNRFFTRDPADLLSTTNFVPRMDSQAHGEMVVLDAFEDRLTRGLYDKSSPNYSLNKSSPIDFRKRNDVVGYGMPDNIVLFTQLNSCQMCLSRIGNSGIARCYWLGADACGGLAHKLCDSVPCYFQMLNRFPADAEILGYVYLLTHPGTPQVFCLHDNDLRDTNVLVDGSYDADAYTAMSANLNALIAARSRIAVQNNAETVNIIAASNGVYRAQITGKNSSLYVKFGNDTFSPQGTWKLVVTGQAANQKMGYAVWESST